MLSNVNLILTEECGCSPKREINTERKTMSKGSKNKTNTRYELKPIYTKCDS